MFIPTLCSKSRTALGCSLTGVCFYSYHE